MRRTAGRARRDERGGRESAREEQRRSRHSCSVARRDEPEDQERTRVNSSKVKNRSLLAGGLCSGPASRRTHRAAGSGRSRQEPLGPPAPQGVIGAITARTAAVSVVDGAIDNGVFNTGRIETPLRSRTSGRSHAGTSWSDDGVDLKLVTQEIEPLSSIPQNQLERLRRPWAVTTHGESSNFTVHVFCLHAVSYSFHISARSRDPRVTTPRLPSAACSHARSPTLSSASSRGRSRSRLISSWAFPDSRSSGSPTAPARRRSTAFGAGSSPPRSTGR